MTKRNKILLIIFLTLALAVSAFGLISVNNVKAVSQPITPELVLPSTNLEYKELSNPIDAYSNENLTVILQSEQIIVFKDGEYKQPINNNSGYLTSLKQVKRLNDDTLIFSSNGNIYTLTLSTGSIEEFMPLFPAIGGNYFDFNENYFVTVYSSTAHCYRFSNGQIIDGNSYTTFDANGDHSIAINQNNEMFFVKNNKLCKRPINLGETVEFTEIAPSKIIANNEFVYYLYNNSLWRIAVGGGEPQQLSSPTSNFALGDFELGKITEPKSISFKGENILITGDNAVQEYKVNDNKLEFTGFAIAENKSAYNRINKSVKEIEREKNTLATLDDNYLTLIDISGSFNAYNPQSFNHVKTDGLKKDGALPDSFALGSSSSLFLYNSGLNTSGLATYDFSAEQATLNAEISISNGSNFNDVVYQSGKYYVLAHKNDTTSQIYVSYENQIDFTLYAEADTHANQMEVDVFGNVYLHKNGVIYSVNLSNGQATALNPNPISNVKKLETDLGGNLFVLSDTAVYFGASLENKVDVNTDGKLLKSFTMDFDKKEVFMVYDNEELIVKTSTLSNLAINDLSIPASFITTSATVNTPLKTFRANSGANVYSVAKDASKFSFNYLVSDDTEYALIGTFSQGGISFYALAGQNDVVLINQNDLIETTKPVDTSVPQSAFITTSVNGYFLPIITADNDYALTDGEIVKLAKEQIIKPKHKITFLDKEYYFAEFTLNDKTYNGYVPINYTIEILSQDFKWDNYSIEKVSKTTVYQEKELVTAIKELENDDSVRLISIEGDVAHIAFSTENGYVNGYISASSIKDAPSVAIRNILIIIAVMASVCGTTTFFILRRKNN